MIVSKHLGKSSLIAFQDFLMGRLGGEIAYNRSQLVLSPSPIKKIIIMSFHIYSGICLAVLICGETVSQLWFQVCYKTDPMFVVKLK